MATAVHNDARIQNRTITVVSGQPTSSKWWWMGAMRNTRRWKVWNTATWMTTDMVIITNSPPTTGSSRWVLVVNASAPRPVPSASEPVSPMKILAGAAFHHRKPAQLPPRAAAMSDRSSAGPTP